MGAALVALGATGGAFTTIAVANETGATVPGAPASLAANVGDGGVTLAWEAPASDGGTAVTGYEYRYRKESETSWPVDRGRGRRTPSGGERARQRHAQPFRAPRSQPTGRGRGGGHNGNAGCDHVQRTRTRRA